MANFNYCPLVWMFSNAISLKKIENLQKRALRFSYKSYNKSFEDLLLKSGFPSMNVKPLRTLCAEIFKSLNNLNPRKKFISFIFMKEIFSLRQMNRPVWEKYKLNLDVPSYNQVTFGRKALTFFGPKTWNSLPYHIKPEENIAPFKTIIKFWNRETCSCKICCKKYIYYYYFAIIIFDFFFIQGYQMTHAFVDSEVKLVSRVTVKLLWKSCPVF